MSSNNDLTKALHEARTPQELRDALASIRQNAVITTPVSGTQNAAPADLTKALENATTHEEISAALDAVRANAVSEAGRSAQPAAAFTRVEKIGGRDIKFEASSQLELERAVTSAYKVAGELLQMPPEPDYSKAGADAAARAIAQTELELRFKRGEVSTADYLEQSGVVKDYLEKQGVPLDELRETVEVTRYKAVEQSWADATTTFLASGSDWPGGEKNKQILGLKLQELGLLDAEDKTAAIAAAYAAMKREGLVFANDGPRQAAPDLARATPQEILEAYKNGRDPQTVNAEFSSLFGRS